MPLLECLVGAYTVPVGGTQYAFTMDRYGRAVAEVLNESHVQIFLSAGTYRKVDAEPDPVPPSEAVEQAAEIGAASALSPTPAEPPQPETPTPEPADPASGETQPPAPAQPQEPPATPPAPPASEPAQPVSGDDLTVITGIGEKRQEQLYAKGITTYAQVAALTPADIAKLDDDLDLKGAITTSNWMSQAKAIAEQIAANGGQAQPATE